MQRKLKKKVFDERGTVACWVLPQAMFMLEQVKTNGKAIKIARDY